MIGAVLDQCAHLEGDSTRIHTLGTSPALIKLKYLALEPKNVCFESSQVIFMCLLGIRGQMCQSLTLLHAVSGIH